MAREILFRGKHVHAMRQHEDLGGRWIYGYLCDESHINSPELEGEFLIDEDTVCQYTGLTDKNGVKIFEGDIVKGVAYSADFIGYIMWIDELAGFGVQYFNRRRNPTAWENSSILKAIQSGRKDRFAAGVIGNIFDNPELLEEGNLRMENKWIVIRGFEYKERLPKEDCKIWITRVFITGERWVQKIDYHAGENIECDGTLAWMPDCEREPSPYMGDDAVVVQDVRS